MSGNDAVLLADSDDAAKDDPIGLVGDASIAAAASGNVITHGCANGSLVGATAGDKYFLDSTPGALTAVAPTGVSSEAPLRNDPAGASAAPHALGNGTLQLKHFL